ncbi:MAG: TaqI-like C-terminal specificity domain-containing protein [Desulfamplus sp.]
MSIFQKSVIKTYLSGIDREQLEKAYQIFRKNYSYEKIEIIKKLKEEEYQDGFLRDIFVDVLGYRLKPEDNFNLVREFKNQSDSKKADGAVLINNTAKAVIELKSTKTKDLKTVTGQAFNYKNNQPDCKYVIISNFQKLHFYIDYANEYEEFDLFRIIKEDLKEEFELLFLILSKDSILNDTPEKLKKESIFHEESVSKQLYADYSLFRKKLFENLTQNNPQVDTLTLFSKSQKLIDRFLFILFAEDKGLLPPNSINRIIERFNTLKEEDSYKPLYEIYKQYFGYMNIGRKGKRAIDDIPAYNGGLFYPDEVLYDLKIDDHILIEDLQKLSAYDFDTDVDVNILGHIFEHSLSEIEETTAKIKGLDVDKTKSKRKKDGIFYTPQYITQYIVENTIGTLCDEKRRELDINEIEVDESFYTKKGELSKKGNILYQNLEDYKNWLLALKILDPACGSGAFLNQALSFLIKEHNFIIEIQTDLNKGQVSMFNVENTVLEKNLYGVDINEESVEITKLSLWLRTAHKDRKLSHLSNNIRCGNSLIDDPEIAGDKAFNWEKEFSEIMRNGGFDVVVGNPPYGVSFNQKEKKYLSCFDNLVPDFQIYIYFISLAVDRLIRDKGLLAYIFPNTFLSILYGKNYREKLIDKFTINEIVDLSDDNTFVDASVRTCILNLTNSIENDYDVVFKKISNDEDKQIEFQNRISNKFLKDNLDNWLSISSTSSNSQTIIDKMRDNQVVNDFFEVSQGLIPYDKYRGHSEYQIKNRVWHSVFKKDDTYKKELKGGDVARYNINWNGKLWISYGDWLAAPRREDFFINPRVLVREITNGFLFCSYTEDEYYNIPSIINIITNQTEIELKYLLSILNSKLMGWYHHSVSPKAKKGLFPKILINDVRNIPIPKISLEDQQPFIEKADIMLAKNREVNELKSDFIENKQKADKLKSIIDSTDREIDLMVYELYELTQEEIEIVEGVKQ